MTSQPQLCVGVELTRVQTPQSFSNRLRSVRGAGSTREDWYTESYSHSQKLKPPHRSPRQLCATNFPGGGPLKTKWPEKK